MTANSAPPVSIIMPVYNSAATIGRALGSIFGQTFHDFELIVVDDGSTDDLDRVLASFADPRLTVLRQRPNKGAPSARNMAIRAARGRYIAFLDSDDEWLPEMLRRQFERFETLPATTGLSIAGYFLQREGFAGRESYPMRETSDWYRYLLAGCRISPGTCGMFRTGVFDEFGFFEESMRRQYDWDWLLRYVARAPIAVVEEPLAIVHVGGRRPAIETVDTSIEIMRRRHAAAMALRPPKERGIFESTLLYERASARFHNGRHLAGTVLLLQAMRAHPAHGAAFYRHLIRRAGDVVLGRFR